MHAVLYNAYGSYVSLRVYPFESCLILVKFRQSYSQEGRFLLRTLTLIYTRATLNRLGLQTVLGLVGNVPNDIH